MYIYLFSPKNIPCFEGFVSRNGGFERSEFNMDGGLIC